MDGETLFAFKRWLSESLRALDSVRGTVIDREADVAAFTWSSTIIHVHLLTEMPKTRALKRMVSENTRVGIGTLYLVDHDLLPSDGEKGVVDEGLMAIHALFRDKIYTYRILDDKPKIGQVHLKSYGRGDEVEVWYGPDVEIRHLPVYRVWVKSPGAIKGEWLMANFGSDAFWKSADYTAGRDAFRKQQRSGFTHRAAWSAGGWGEGPQVNYDTAEPSPGAAIMETHLQRSYQQLGVVQGAPYDEVKAAFRRLARELHPDVSKLPKLEAETKFKTLNEAYTYIKSRNGWV